MNKERIITGKFILKSPLHIGVGKENEPTDAPVRRTGDGQIFIPGRALGGVLRNAATLLAPRFPKVKVCNAIRRNHPVEKICNCPVCQLFGEFFPGVEPKQKKKANEAEREGGRASRLWIDDAFLLPGDHGNTERVSTHIRDGVGICRQRCAAQPQAKFDHETVPANVAFDFRMRLVDDDSDDAKRREKILVAALAEWQAARARIGGSSSRGLGKFQLSELKIFNLEVNEDNLVDYLVANNHYSDPSKKWLVLDREWPGKIEKLARSKVRLVTKLNRGDQEYACTVMRSFVTVELTLSFDGPFLSNEPVVAALSGFDHAPMVDLLFDDVRKPIITGASLRGALRSRAEKIARTLTMLNIQTNPDDDYDTFRTEFLQKCPACAPLELAKDDSHLPLESCDSRWRRYEKSRNEEIDSERTSKQLCLSCRLFGSTRLGSRLVFEDAEWAGEEPGEEIWKPQDFLAIDRFTGGGLDGAKFDAAPLINPKFNVRLTLHNPHAWELGWLALVLRDLWEGEITLGFGAAKGYGRPRGESLSWEIGYITNNDFPIDEPIVEDGLIPSKNESTSGLFKTVSGDLYCDGEAWSNAAKEWVNKFNQTVRDFNGGEMTDEMTDKELATFVPQFEQDTYLKETPDKLFDLYGLPRTGEEGND